jgi:GNAT superfamily N-acetyltransferase
MMCEVRRAWPEDAAAIARVHIEAWKSTYTGLIPEHFIARRTAWDVRYPMWVERLGANPPAFVASDADGVFGFASACPMPERLQDYEPLRYHAYLQAIYLLAGRQRYGAGRALLAAVARDLITRDCTSMALHVLATNPSRGFYERLGAVHVRDEPLDPDMSAHSCAYAFTDLAALIID